MADDDPMNSLAARNARATAQRQLTGQLSHHIPAHPDEARRMAQRMKNIEIGDDSMVWEPPRGEVLTIEQMLGRFVYCSTTEQIAVMPPADAPRRRLPLFLWVSAKRAYSTSVHEEELPPEDGETRPRRRTVVHFDDWWRNAERIQVEAPVIAIGRDRYTVDPEGNLAVNLWTALVRRKPQRFEECWAMLEEHVRYLVPVEIECELFLDWLAHCEQKPRVLPHYGWLMWTSVFGIGRNWLASVLTRVWRGEVAASLDMQGLLDSQFNGRIGCKRFAFVDEIHIGDSGRSRYAMEAKLRQIMTQEFRTVNPKYGREILEFNVMRWLILSNHEDALPIQVGDRRLVVVHNPEQKRSEEDYTRLYNALDDEEFIDAVAWGLSQRDIGRFNPGREAMMTDAKRSLIEATTPEMERELAALLKEWPCAYAASEDLLAALGIGSGDASASQRKHFGMAMKRMKHRQYGRVTLPNKHRVRVWVLAGNDAPADQSVPEAIAAYRATNWYVGLVPPNADRF